MRIPLQRAVNVHGRVRQQAYDDQHDKQYATQCNSNWPGAMSLTRRQIYNSCCSGIETQRAGSARWRDGLWQDNALSITQRATTRRQLHDHGLLPSKHRSSRFDRSTTTSGERDRVRVASWCVKNSQRFLKRKIICTGPLVTAMQEGAYLMLDEISLADDSVLERLNPVLEDERTLPITDAAARSALGGRSKSNNESLVY